MIQTRRERYSDTTCRRRVGRRDDGEELAIASSAPQSTCARGPSRAPHLTQATPEVENSSPVSSRRSRAARRVSRVQSGASSAGRLRKLFKKLEIPTDRSTSLREYQKKIAAARVRADVAARLGSVEPFASVRRRVSSSSGARRRSLRRLQEPARRRFSRKPRDVRAGSSARSVPTLLQKNGELRPPPPPEVSWSDRPGWWPKMSNGPNAKKAFARHPGSDHPRGLT